MNAKRTVVAAIVTILVFGLFADLSQAAQDKNKDKQAAKQEEKVFIPPQVKTIMQEGMAARQGRQDIPFTIFKNFIFPAVQNLHTVFLFKAKNSDLGYVPAAAPAAQAPAQGDQAQSPAAAPLRRS